MITYNVSRLDLDGNALVGYSKGAVDTGPATVRKVVVATAFLLGVSTVHGESRSRGKVAQTQQLDPLYEKGAHIRFQGPFDLDPKVSEWLGVRMGVKL